MVAGRMEDRSPDAFPERKERASKKADSETLPDCDISKTNCCQEILDSPAFTWAPTQIVRKLLSGIFTRSESQ